MKLTRDLNLINNNLGGFLFTDKELKKGNITNDIIAEKLTKFFLESDTNLIENMGFEYTYPQLNQIKKLLKTDSSFILNILNDQFNPLNGDILVSEYERYLKSVRGEFDIKMIQPTPYNGDGILEQISYENSVKQAYEGGKVIQIAGAFSSQIAGSESSQTAGNYSKQIAENDSYQIAGRNSIQIAGENTDEQVSGDFSNQRTGSNSNSVTGSNSEQQTVSYSILDCRDKCIQIAEYNNKLYSGNNCNIKAKDFNEITTGMYSVIEIDSFNTVKADDYSVINANNDNVFKVGEDCIIAVKDNNTITVMGGNLKLISGMNNTIYLNSINGYMQYHSNIDFNEFSDIEFIDGLLVTN